jgi:2-polyprenyl-3-methyl-5-hydroxy-6-metoxy-1,4-benzoquinol methylase
MTPFMEKWIHYRDTRAGDYDYRCRTRYKAVADTLFLMGLDDGHSVRDIGAGSCQFGQYLHERGWRGDYIPVDAVIDGTNLDDYIPRRADFIVSIETLEHLRYPVRLLALMRRAARSGMVITTPNPEAVDVLDCDPTHISVVSRRDLYSFHMQVERHSWFGIAEDTLLGWRRCD